MSYKSIDTQLLSYFHSLSKPQQLDVLDYLRSLLKKDSSSNKGLLKLAGSITSEDLKLMDEAIKEGCEQIDKDEW
jgi:hypothetical protein